MNALTVNVKMESILIRVIAMEQDTKESYVKTVSFNIVSIKGLNYYLMCVYVD